VKRWIVSAAAIGLLALAAWPQWRSFDRLGERRFAALQDPAREVLVGVCWPSAANHDGMIDGLHLAQDEINARAGGHSIRLVVRDDDFDWERAKRIAIEFAETPDMSAVIGYYDDGPAVKASAIFESSRLLHLIVGANNTAMTSHGFQYLVRTTLSSNKIARALARMTAGRGYRKVALIWEEDAYGEDLAYQYSVSLDDLDIPVVYRWSFAREHADFRLPVNELKGIDADLIVFAGLEPWAGDFLRNLRAVGVTTPTIGAFSDTPAMRERAGPGLDGAMYFDMYDAAEPSPENQAFVRTFQGRYGRLPDAWAAQGYDALQILAKSIAFTGSRNPLDLSYAIRFMDAWHGANGRYKFNAAGELDDKPIFLKVFRHGVPETLEASRPALPGR
jgi:branched-chain amino acid transport system substrate-binding protein